MIDRFHLLTVFCEQRTVRRCIHPGFVVLLIVTVVHSTFALSLGTLPIAILAVVLLQIDWKDRVRIGAEDDHPHYRFSRRREGFLLVLEWLLLIAIAARPFWLPGWWARILAIFATAAIGGDVSGMRAHYLFNTRPPSRPRIE